MSVVVQSPATMVDVQTSGISWTAVAAGGAAAAALTLLLVAFGAGIGLSAISPWADSGVSATTFKIGTGIYLCVVAVMASSVGGYLAARLRTRWVDTHPNEVFFRDTAHGFITWAFATLLSAGVLTAATSHIVSGAAGGLAPAAAQAAPALNPADLYVDRLLRAGPAAPGAPAAAAPPAAGNSDSVRSELVRLWSASFRDSRDLQPGDRAYVASIVAARTGLNQAEAEKRVNDVVAEAKAATDKARKAAAQLALWLAASLLLGAFAASLAAVEGGQLRDGTWNGRVLTPRAL